MAESAFKQDMPPPGGYKSFNFKRIPGQKYFSNRFLFLYFGSTTIIAFSGYLASRQRWRHYRLEVCDRDIAIEPFFTAERDRAFLKYLKKSREEEEKIFDGVSNWKVSGWSISL